MSQQAHLWSRYHAAALQTTDAEHAAKKADKALEEYNKRFETLAKHEHEMAELTLTLEMRNEQEYIGLCALMAASSMFEYVDATKTVNVNINDHWMSELRQLAKNHLHLVNGRWTIVPHGMDPNNPKLGKRSP